MPPKLHELISQREALTIQGREILATIRGRGDEAAASAEEQGELDKIKANLEKLNAQTKLLAEEQELERLAGELVFDHQARQTEDGDGSVLYPTVSGVRDRREGLNLGGFVSSIEFFESVMRADSGVMDPRLEKFKAAQGSDEQSTTEAGYGGFLVPEAVAPGLLRVRPEMDPISRFTRKIPMTAQRVSFNARVDKDHRKSVSGGLIVTRRAELVDGVASRMRFEQVRLDSHELFGVAFATEKVLRESPVSFAALLREGFGEEFASHGLNERLWGTGVGEPLGIMSVGANGPLVSVAKEAAQANATINKENIDKMESRCWMYGRAIWLANHTTRPQLKSLHQVIGDAGALVNYFQTSPNGQEYLSGRPIFFTEYAETLGKKGDLILGVWSEYLDGMRGGGIKQASSIHVRFLSNERTFKFWMENDGRPWWTSTLTPKKGVTLAPFVVLANRS